MIKEGTGLFVAGRGEVVPYTGKYAVKTADVFDLVEAGFARVGLGHAAAAYRPLRVEFELTTRCNDSCPSCGMGAMPMRDGVTLTDADLDRLVGEFASIALPSVAVTGGEPFAAMRALRRVVAACQGAGIDVSKLTSNGWWGSERRCGPGADDAVGERRRPGRVAAWRDGMVGAGSRVFTGAGCRPRTRRRRPGRLRRSSGTS